jgi:hypothetical protein
MTTPRHVHRNDPMSAGWANGVVDAMGGLRSDGSGALQISGSLSGTDVTSVQPQLFNLVNLAVNIQGTAGKTATRLQYNDSSTPYFQVSSETLANVADPFIDSGTGAGVYLAGERHATFFLPTAGQRVPVPSVQWHLGKVITSPISAGGSGTVEIYYINSGTLTDSTLHVTAYDFRTSGPNLDVGTQVYVWQHNQSRRWFISQLPPSVAYNSASITVSGGAYTGAGGPFLLPLSSSISGNFGLPITSNQFVVSVAGDYLVTATVVISDDTGIGASTTQQTTTFTFSIGPGTPNITGTLTGMVYLQDALTTAWYAPPITLTISAVIRCDPAGITGRTDINAYMAATSFGYFSAVNLTGFLSATLVNPA